MAVIKSIGRVIFVSVIHTDTESLEQARRAVLETEPDVVAVELDRARYAQLTNPDVSEEEVIPDSGDMISQLLNQIALLEDGLGSLSGTSAGEEMLAAIEAGRKTGAKIALIDRPIQATAQALLKIPLDEIYKMTNLIPDATEDIQDGGAVDIMSMLKEEGAIDKLMDEFREEFPNIAKVLIEDRDEYIANAILTILEDVDGKVVVVLGAGHIDGVKKALQRVLKTKSAS